MFQFVVRDVLCIKPHVGDKENKVGGAILRELEHHSSVREMLPTNI